MKTMNVYFDIPAKKCVILLEVDVSSYSAEKTQKGVSHMMGAEAIAVDARTYHMLVQEYGS